MENGKASAVNGSANLGWTRLGNNSGAVKNTPRLEAMGTLDELTGWLSFSITSLPKCAGGTFIAEQLSTTQKDVIELRENVSTPVLCCPKFMSRGLRLPLSDLMTGCLPWRTRISPM